MEACVMRDPRPRSTSPPRQMFLGGERRRELVSQWQDEVEERDGPLMRWLRESRVGRWLCLMAILLVRLLVLLLIIWLVSLLHTGLGVPCLLVLLSLWVHGERKHAAFSSYLRHLCEMAHGSSRPPRAP